MLQALLFCALLTAVFNGHANFVKATDDVLNLSPYELQTILAHLMNPSPEYQLQATALRRQLKKMIAQGEEDVVAPKAATIDYGDEQYEDYPVIDDKRSVSALAAQGVLNQRTANPSLATSASNQLPPQESYDYGEHESDPAAAAAAQEKRYIGALARAGRLQSYGKRNIAMLARDYQLPKQMGKRNLATLARLGRLQPSAPLSPKRNMAAMARYNSRRFYDGDADAVADAVANANVAADADANAVVNNEKRNLGALKASPVHGKRMEADAAAGGYGMQDFDYAEYVPNYWMYPISYADLDWGDFGRARKRFLGRIFPPTRATASTHRSRL